MNERLKEHELARLEVCGVWAECGDAADGRAADCEGEGERVGQGAGEEGTGVGEHAGGEDREDGGAGGGFGSLDGLDFKPGGVGGEDQGALRCWEGCGGLFGGHGEKDGSVGWYVL